MRSICCGAAIPEPATAELLETIDTQTRRLQRFVDELLDVARISRGLIEVRRESVDLVSVVREAARAIEPFIDSRRHKLSLILPARPVYVSGDAGRLNQVVTNLLENAAKYTDPGGEIRLALEPQDNGVTLSVRDNGIGIAPEDLEHVFEPFTQAHRGVADRGGGLGLGLSVVRRVLELHGGRIEATSKGLTRGSEFVAWLPLLAHGQSGCPEAGDADACATCACRGATRATGAHRRRSRRISGHRSPESCDRLAMRSRLRAMARPRSRWQRAFAPIARSWTSHSRG